VEDDFLRVIGGPSAENVLEGRDGGIDVYWPRVWAARGLLHVWDDVATDAIIYGDDARRMARTRDVGQGDRATSRRSRIDAVVISWTTRTPRASVSRSSVSVRSPSHSYDADTVHHPTTESADLRGFDVGQLTRDELCPRDRDDLDEASGERDQC